MSSSRGGDSRTSSRQRRSSLRRSGDDASSSVSSNGNDNNNNNTTATRAASASKSSGSKQRKSQASVVVAEDLSASMGTGCLICKQDNDHAKLMLCEGCNGEYHIYCLNPPLEAVPEDDWFCAKCAHDESVDNLDELVSALPIDYTSRFNEICWCQGGVGYGWWPACIFNPCLAIGAARSQAIKNLGKRHLVYFFYCAEAPFEIKADSTIMSWEMGLAMGYHIGRTAYAHGKRRYKQFQLALQAACIEESVPKQRRLKWTFTDEPERIAAAVVKGTTTNTTTTATSTTAVASGSRASSTRSGGSSTGGGGGGGGRDLQSALDEAKTPPRSNGKRKRGVNSNNNSNAVSSDAEPSSSPVKRSTREKSAAAATRSDEPSSRDQLFCQVFRRTGGGDGADDAADDDDDVPVGFVYLPSQKASFADVRRYIKQDLDAIPVEWSWRFWVPRLGVLSTRQESKFGSMLAFLWRTSSKAQVGAGTRDKPVRVILVDAPKI